MKYSLEDILEMLGGYRYYSREQILYVYNHVNGLEEEAKYYLEIMREENKKIEEASIKLKTEAELKQLSNDNT